MPLEIKELHIRVSVNLPDSKAAGQASPTTAPSTPDQREAIVAECVEQLMGVLKNKKER